MSKLETLCKEQVGELQGASQRFEAFIRLRDGTCSPPPREKLRETTPEDLENEISLMAPEQEMAEGDLQNLYIKTKDALSSYKQYKNLPLGTINDNIVLRSPKGTNVFIKVYKELEGDICGDDTELSLQHSEGAISIYYEVISELLTIAEMYFPPAETYTRYFIEREESTAMYVISDQYFAHTIDKEISDKRYQLNKQFPVLDEDYLRHYFNNAAHLVILMNVKRRILHRTYTTCYEGSARQRDLNKQISQIYNLLLKHIKQAIVSGEELILDQKRRLNLVKKHLEYEHVRQYIAQETLEHETFESVSSEIKSLKQERVNTQSVVHQIEKKIEEVRHVYDLVTESGKNDNTNLIEVSLKIANERHERKVSEAEDQIQFEIRSQKDLRPS